MRITVRDTPVDKPLVDCKFIAASDGSPSIGYHFDNSFSGRNATSAYLQKLTEHAFDIIATPGTAPLMEIYGEDQISGYLELGGKIVRPGLVNGLYFSMKEWESGFYIENTYSIEPSELKKLTKNLDSMGVLYRLVVGEDANQIIQIGEPLSIKVLLESGAQFWEAAQFTQNFHWHWREMWAAGGSELLLSQLKNEGKSGSVASFCVGVEFEYYGDTSFLPEIHESTHEQMITNQRTSEQKRLAAGRS